MFLQSPRRTAVSSVDVGNFLDSLCVDSKKYNKKKGRSERERVGRACESKDYKDTGRRNENTQMDELTKTGRRRFAPYVPG